MKSKILTFLAVGLMVSACGGNQTKDSQAVETEKQSEVTQEEEETRSSSDDPTGIISIRKTWAEKPIKVGAGEGKVGIGQLAKAFCQTYPQCETVNAMGEYLKTPNNDGEPISVDGLMYDVEVDQRNGFARCMMLVETSPFMDACYWNRKNGHKLFAAYMEEAHESGAYAEILLVFYDYDPATDVMTPDADVNAMFEEYMKNPDDYALRLPQEGKDIIVYNYVYDEENDSAKTSEITFIWNGDTFERK